MKLISSPVKPSQLIFPSLILIKSCNTSILVHTLMYYMLCFVDSTYKFKIMKELSVCRLQPFSDAILFCVLFIFFVGNLSITSE